MSKNTKRSGFARIIIYPYQRWHIAVCLDFNIIEEDEDREELEKSIKEAVYGYIETIRKCNVDNVLLNRPADKKYWKMYESYVDMLKNKAQKPLSHTLKKMSLIVIPISAI